MTLKHQILFYLTIKIKLPGWVHRSSYSQSPFPYLDHVELPEKGSKLSSGETFSSPSWIPFTLRKRDKYAEFHLCVLSKNTYITFFFPFFPPPRGGLRWSSICVCSCKYLFECIHSMTFSCPPPIVIRWTGSVVHWEKWNMWLPFCWWTNTAEAPEQIRRRRI